MKTKASITLLLLLSITFSSFAGSGSATTPKWLKRDGRHYTIFNISNVSSVDANVFIKLIDIDGNAYTEDTEPGDNITIHANFSEDPVSENGAILPASKMGVIVIEELGTQKSGYCLIEWISDGNNTTALIGNVKEVSINSDGSTDSSYMLINCGQPF